MAETTYTLTINGATVDITISAIIGGSRTITSVAGNSGGNRGIQIVYAIDGEGVSFHYGAQVDEGGVVMGNNAIVDGNIFSNGDIIGGNGSQITGTAQIAGPGKKLSNVDIGVDAYVDICEDNGTVVTGVLHANVPGNCNYGSWDTSGLPVEAIALPIAGSWIQQRRDEAALGGTVGTQNISGAVSLGPKKIEGDLIVGTGATLTITGTLWVTGQFQTNNNSVVKLSAGYGNNSGIVIGDDFISILNNTVISGSGEEGSYVMVIGGKDDPLQRVMSVGNNSLGAIYYANHGRIHLNNNAEAREVSAYGVDLDPNATVTYEIGLQDPVFVSGPSAGGWRVVSWREIGPGSGLPQAEEIQNSPSLRAKRSNLMYIVTRLLRFARNDEIKSAFGNSITTKLF